MTTKATGGFRIRYEKHNDNLMVSIRIFSDGKRLVKVILNTELVEWSIVDAVTGHIYEKGGDSINNMEVLQRSAKKAIKKFIGVEFQKEYRKAGQFAHLTKPNK